MHSNAITNDKKDGVKILSDEYNTTFYKEASRKDRAYFLSCRIQHL
jgi:hypothetical protein